MLSLLYAGQCDSEVAIRLAESELWRMGCRPNCSKEFADRYRSAHASDPGFFALIDAHTQLAALYRQKRGMELDVARLCRQILDVTAKRDRLQREYETIKKEEGLE